MAISSQIVGKYEMGRVLAAGDFDCRTRICTHVVTGAQYAVRIYDKNILAEAAWMWNQIREAVQVMRTLPKHENIVEMVECFETQTSLYILMQLHSPIQITKMYTAPDVDIPLSKTKYYFTQVVKGVTHLHENGVVHLGIAPDHIMINDREQVKIGFLVSCRFFKKGEKMTDMKGTKHSVAPEVLRQEPYNPLLADAWSLGVLLFFMLNGGQYPHDGANTSKNILNGKIRQLNPALPVQARDLVSQLLAYNPENRMSVADILNHPWMCENRSDDDEAYVKGPNGSRHLSVSVVESSYDPGSEVLSIVIPKGLSQRDEAAYIIQHIWRMYVKKKATMARSRSASFRLKRVAKAQAAVGGLSRRGSLGAPDTSLVARRKSRDDSAGSQQKTLRSPSASDSEKAAASRHHHGALGSNPHQCSHCGRLPPQRVVPGKSPYPDAKYKLTKEMEFKETNVAISA